MQTNCFTLMSDLFYMQFKKRQIMAFCLLVKTDDVWVNLIMQQHFTVYHPLP